MSSSSIAPHVVAVACRRDHTFSKTVVDRIQLVAGLGVVGDAHAGATVQHLSRVRRDPTQPNLRQVHLLHAELFDELRQSGLDVGPGQLGENITTRGLDVLALPTGALLRMGSAVVEVTGLRNPCRQIEDFRPGALAVVVTRGEDGSLVRKAGVMGVVVVGGAVRPGDRVDVELPPLPHRPLEPV